MASLSPGRDTFYGRGITPLLAVLLLATTAASAVAVRTGTLEPLILLVMAGIVTAVAIRRPILLFYVYCAAIPFNFALPPGPAGTVARIAGLAFFVGYLFRRPNALRPGTVPIAGWAFVAWTLASCLWAGNTQAAFDAWLSLVQLFAISVLIASVVAADPEVVRPALWAYALSAAATAAIGSISYLQSPTIYLDRAVAFSGQDPALFACILLPAIVFMMWEVQSRAAGLPVRLVAFAALLVCVAGLVLSGTRSGWIGIIASAVAWLLLQRERRQLLSLAAVGIGVVIMAASVPGMADFLLGRVGSSAVTGGAGRTDIWAVGLYMLASNPLTGVGFGNFPLAYTPYVVDQASAGFVPIYALSAGRGAHNVLLGTFVETGVVGAVLLVVLCASALWQTSDARIMNVVRATLVGLFVQSLFLDILGQKQVWLFIAIAFGLGAARRVAVSAATSTSSPDTDAATGMAVRAGVRSRRDAGDPLPTPR
jgi:O-antigen ligase